MNQPIPSAPLCTRRSRHLTGILIAGVLLGSLLGVSLTANAQTADDWVLTGRGHLQSQNIVSANAAFQQAVLVNANHQEANFFYGITRLAVLPFVGGANSVGGLLDGFGVSSTGRVYKAWTADLPRNIFDEIVLPTNSPTPSIVVHVAVTTVLPQIEGALSNLNKITTGFVTHVGTEFGLTPQLTLTPATEFDYGDVLLMKASLCSAKAAILIAASYNVDFDVDVVFGKIRDGVFDPNLDVLGPYPQFLTLLPTTQLATAKPFVNQAINYYMAASTFIRAETDDQTDDAGVITAAMADDEQTLRDRLTEVQAALSGPATINPTPTEQYTLDLTQFFDAPKNIRAYLPTFRVGESASSWPILERRLYLRIVANSFPDPTFGGIAPGLDQDWWTTKLELKPGWNAEALRVGTDGKLRLLWRNPDDQSVCLWILGSGGTYESSTVFGPYAGWSVADFVLSRFDNSVHLVWTNTNGAISLWNLNSSGVYQSSQTFGPYADWSYHTLQISPVDGRQHLAWSYYDGQISLWRLNNNSILQSTASYGPYAGWSLDDVVISPVDGKVRLLWQNYGDGIISLWRLSDAGNYEASTVFGPYSYWMTAALDISAGDNKVRLLWKNWNTGEVSFWRLTTTDAFESANTFGPFAGWEVVGLALRPDNKALLPWTNWDGAVSGWLMTSNGAFELAVNYGPYAGWAMTDGGVDGVNKTHLLWQHTTGQISVWRLSATLTLETTANYGPY